MRASVAVLACFYAFAERSGFAQTRPLLTEEATTTRAGRLGLEAGVDFIQGQLNFLTGGERERWDAPLLRLTYAPASSVELDLEWVGRVFARKDPDFGSVSDWGDVTLRAKWRFLEEDLSRPALAARFGVTLPQTSFGNGLGPNTLRMSAQLLLSKGFRGFTLHANAGLALQDEVLRPHEQRDFLAYGLAVVRPLGSLSLVAEVAGLAGKGTPGADARSEARAGFRYEIGQITWDAAIRRGLAKADGDWGFSGGLSWVLREGR